MFPLLGNLGVELEFGDFDVQSWDLYELHKILSVILTSDDLRS